MLNTALILAALLLAGNPDLAAAAAPHHQLPAAAPAPAPADSSATAIWTGVGTMMLTIILAAGGFLIVWLNNGKTLMVQVGELHTQVHNLSEKLAECQLEHAQVQIREAQYKADLERTQLRITVLENATGIHPPQPPMLAGILITDKQGIIQEASPALSVFLGWAPEDLREQPADILVPERLKEGHRKAFLEAMQPSYVIDPTRKINTHALDKTGREIPVTLTVREWPGDDGMLTAIIEPRASANSIPPPLPGQQPPAPIPHSLVRNKGGS